MAVEQLTRRDVLGINKLFDLGQGFLPDRPAHTPGAGGTPRDYRLIDSESVRDDGQKKLLLSRRALLVLAGMTGIPLFTLMRESYPSLQRAVEWLDQYEGLKPPYGEKVEGGRIIFNCDEFIESVGWKIVNNEPVSPDPDILKSAAYHGLRYLGLSRLDSLVKAHNIAIYRAGDGFPSTCSQRQSMCVEGNVNAPHRSISEWIMIPETTFVPSENVSSSSQWLSPLQRVFHETAHAQTTGFQVNPPQQEKYGNFGVSEVTERDGFLADIESDPFVVTYTDSQGIVLKPNRLEEFFADTSSVEIMRHHFGSADEYSFGSPYYTFTSNGIARLYNSSNYIDPYWPALMAKLYPRVLAPYHRRSDRYRLIVDFGRDVVERNPHAPELDDAYLAGVAFNVIIGMMQGESWEEGIARYYEESFTRDDVDMHGASLLDHKAA